MGQQRNSFSYFIILIIQKVYNLKVQKYYTFQSNTPHNSMSHIGGTIQGSQAKQVHFTTDPRTL